MNELNECIKTLINGKVSLWELGVGGVEKKVRKDPMKMIKWEKWEASQDRRISISKSRKV